MMEVNEKNGADIVLEDDDQVMVNVVKDDGLMMVEMEYDGWEREEDSDTDVMMEEIGCFEMVNTISLVARTKRF